MLEEHDRSSASNRSSWCRSTDRRCRSFPPGVEFSGSAGGAASEAPGDERAAARRMGDDCGGGDCSGDCSGALPGRGIWFEKTSPPPGLARRLPLAPLPSPLDLPPGDFDDRDDDDVLDGDLPRVAAAGEEEARTVASMTGGGTPGTVPWSTERPHQSMTRTRDLSGRPLCSRCTRSAGTYHESSHHRFRAPTVVCGTTNTRRGGTPRRRRVVQTPRGWEDEAIEERERERESGELWMLGCVLLYEVVA